MGKKLGHNSFSRRLFVTALASVFLFGPGCGLIPKNVEFFQKKIRPVPEKVEKAKERERQAAEYVDSQLQTAKDQAVTMGLTNGLFTSITNAKTVSGPLSVSLGPPESKWTGPPQRLGDDLLLEVAKLNRRLDIYTQSNQKIEGKKVEGTGLVNVPYFVYIVIVGGLVFLAIIGIKIALGVLSATNPAIGLGANVVKGLGSKVIAKGFSQIVKGGEEFLKRAEEEISDPDLYEKVKQMFLDEQQKAQDQHIKDAIKQLTH